MELRSAVKSSKKTRVEKRNAEEEGKKKKNK